MIQVLTDTRVMTETFPVDAVEALRKIQAANEYGYFGEPSMYGGQAREHLLNLILTESTDLIPNATYSKLTDVWITGEGELNSAEENFSPPGIYVINDKKRVLQASAFMLQNAVTEGTVEPVESELVIAAQYKNMQRLMMAEAASAMNYAQKGSAERLLAQESYMKLSKEVYGVMDTEAFFGIMNTEKSFLGSFYPKNELETKMKAEVLAELAYIPEGAIEPTLLSQGDIDALKPLVMEFYGASLEGFPSSDEQMTSVEAIPHLVKMFDILGLTNKGWTVELCSVDNMSSSSSDKKLEIPVGKSYTEKFWRAVAVHEAMHAYRSANGPVKVLSEGTADYTGPEEGFGVAIEIISWGDTTNEIAKLARDRYIHVGLALGEDGKKRTASQVSAITTRLEYLHRVSKGEDHETARDGARKDVKEHIINIYRSTDFTTPGVIYNKAKIYYEGLRANCDYLRSIIGNREAFTALFQAKYNHLNETESAQVAQLVASIKYSKR